MEHAEIEREKNQHAEDEPAQCQGVISTESFAIYAFTIYAADCKWIRQS